MKMKKKLFALLALLLVLSLAACGGASKNSAAGIATDSAPQDAPSTPQENYNAAEMGWDIPAMAEEGDFAPEPSPGGGSYGGVPANAKIIYTASLALETREFDDASKALAALVADMGGYFESKTVNQGYYRSMDAVVRVPVANFTAFLDRAGETAHAVNRSEYLDDVSEAYYDQESRLTTQRVKLERLQELLGKAEDMADIITIESAISDTELEIEYLTGSLRKYDSQINYSTISLSLSEVYRLSTDEEVPVTFGQRLASAFSTGCQRGVEGLEDFAVGVARNWVGLLIWAVILAAAVLLIRRQLRKKAARRKFYAPHVPPVPPAPPPTSPMDPVPSAEPADPEKQENKDKNE